MSDLQRPECFEFGMDFLGTPEEPIIRAYVELLEAKVRLLENTEVVYLKSTDQQSWVACSKDEYDRLNNRYRWELRTVPDELDKWILVGDVGEYDTNYACPKCGAVYLEMADGNLSNIHTHTCKCGFKEAT